MDSSIVVGCIFNNNTLFQFPLVWPNSVGLSSNERSEELPVVFLLLPVFRQQVAVFALSLRTEMYACRVSHGESI